MKRQIFGQTCCTTTPSAMGFWAAMVMDAVIRGKQVYCGSRWPGSCTRVAVLVFKDRKVVRLAR
jgi:hypothetical protein